MTRTIAIDVRLPGCRVKTASGVTDRRTAKAMRAMLRALWAQEDKRSLVRAIGRTRTLADVYVAYLEGRLGGLKPTVENRLLYDARETWLAGFDCSDSHRHRLKQSFRILEALQQKARIEDLPELLVRYREHCVKAATPRQFNYAKNAARALLRDLVGKRDPLYERIADLHRMREAKAGPKGLTIPEALKVRQALPPKAAAIWWAMCWTGMGPTEFWGSWTVLGDRVRIRGTKRPGRRWGSEGRDVPLIVTPVRPELSLTRFVRLMRAAGGVARQGRKSFSRWLEDAGVPRTRRQLYLGHGVKDITDIYERHDVDEFLADDAGRLKALLGRNALEVAK